MSYNPSDVHSWLKDAIDANHQAYRNLFAEKIDGETDLDQVRYISERLRADTVKFQDFGSLSDIFSNNSPSDFISFTKDTKSNLNKYFVTNFDSHSDSKGDTIIPNDIFIANTIPLPDFCFVMDIYDEQYTKLINEFVIRFLFHEGQLFIIFNDTQQRKIITAVKLKNMDDEHLIIDDSIVFCNRAHDPLFKRADYKAAIKTMTLAIANHMLAEWYAVQVLLLNPVIKERIFTQGDKKKLRVNDSAIIGLDTTSKKTRKRKAKYIRYKNIDQDLFKSKVLRKQHTLCWYVIGHYRHYQNGRKTFVHGYWKGPLRELKKNLDSGRERIIAQ